LQVVIPYDRIGAVPGGDALQPDIHVQFAGV